MKYLFLLYAVLIHLNTNAQDSTSPADFNSLRFALTYGSVTEQRFETQSLSFQFHYENILFKETKWTYRLGAGYARGFARALVTDTRDSRLNEFTVQGVLNYNLGNYQKIDIQFGAGPYASYINGDSERYSGEGSVTFSPAEDFSIVKVGAQAIGRVTWYGQRNTHSILSYVRLSNNMFVSTGFGYEIGI